MNMKHSICRLCGEEARLGNLCDACLRAISDDMKTSRLTVARVANMKGCVIQTVYSAIDRGELEAAEWGLEDGAKQTVISAAAAEAWTPRSVGRPAKPVLPDSKRRTIAVKAMFSPEEHAQFESRKHEGEAEAAAVRRFCCGDS